MIDRVKLIFKDERMTVKSSTKTNIDSSVSIPRRLTVLNDLDTVNSNAKQYLYVDDENTQTSSKISLKELASSVVKTVESIPINMQPGQYIFLKKGDN